MDQTVVRTGSQGHMGRPCRYGRSGICKIQRDIAEQEKIMLATKLHVLLTTLSLLSALAVESALAQEAVTPAEARAIAKEAYIYGFPTVDNCRVHRFRSIRESGHRFYE
jgi:hypothetical protein